MGFAVLCSYCEMYTDEKCFTYSRSQVFFCAPSFKLIFFVVCYQGCIGKRVGSCRLSSLTFNLLWVFLWIMSCIRNYLIYHYILLKFSCGENDHLRVLKITCINYAWWRLWQQDDTDHYHHRHHHQFYYDKLIISFIMTN